jgi:co-chaperonin GroES (HSP10)
MEVIPTGNRVIIERDQEELSKIIVIPNQRESLFGVIVACGPKVKHLKAGTRVILRQTVGHELTYDIQGEKVKYVIVEEDEVDGVIDNG